MNFNLYLKNQSNDLTENVEKKLRKMKKEDLELIV